MATRYEVEVTITSANDLKNVNWRHGKLKPYAVLWIHPNSKFSTHVDEEGDTCPVWNEKLTIPFNTPINDSTLYIDIVHANTDNEGTKLLIGSCELKLCDIVNEVGFESVFDKKLELKRPSGRPHGNLKVKVIVRMSRYPDYSAPPVGHPYSAGYPYPIGHPYSAGYPYPIGHPYSAGYPYPVGYPYGGYVPPGYYGQQGNTSTSTSSSSMLGGVGTGLGVGAVAGALGGVALAEGVNALEEKIEDDVVERVEEDLVYDGDDF